MLPLKFLEAPRQERKLSRGEEFYGKWDWAKEYQQEIKDWMFAKCTKESGCVYDRWENGGSNHYGAYQFNPSTYINVGNRLGFTMYKNGKIDWSEEMQDRVALGYAQETFDRTGSLDDVACNWYTGKDCSVIIQEGWWHTKQGIYPSMNQYLADIHHLIATL